MRIESKPTSVRGLGNVLNLKSPDDFVNNHSEISSDVGEEYTVFTMKDSINPVFWVYTLPEIKQYVSCNLIFCLKDEDDTVLSGLDVSVYIEDTLLDVFTTDSDGEISFNLDTSEFGLKNVKLVFEGTDEYSSNTLNLELDVLRKVIAHCNSWSWCSCRSADTDEPIENVAFYVDARLIGYTNSDGIFPGYTISVHPYRCSFEKESHYFQVIYDD